MASPESAPQRSLLERALGLVTDVRAGEGGTALLMTLNLFLLLGAYYVLKPIREALILVMGESGARYKSYMSAVIAVGLLVAVPAYSAFAKRVPRNRLVVSVTLFFASHLVLFYLANLSDAIRPYLGLLFFFWIGIFNMMVVAQLWAFANDLYTEDQGKRLFPLIGVGASVGSAAGSAYGILTRGTNVYVMMLAAAGMLVVVAVLSQVVHRREIDRETKRASVAPPPPDTGGGAFELVFKTPYLLLIAVFSVLFTLVNTNGGFMMDTLVADWSGELEAANEIPDGMDRSAFIKAFYDEFYFWVNTAGVILQTFVVSRIVKYFGMRGAFLLFPVVALLDATLIAFIPVLALLKYGKIAENSLDYSLNNTVRNMLWLPTTKEMKYRAKQAIDSFFVRMGDVGSAAFVFVMAEQLELGVRAFAIANAVMIAAWLAIAWAILKQRERLLAEQGIDEGGARAS
jgi:AAA family ATP:ADP antiporter